MRYLFTNGSDGNLNDPANWRPAGQPGTSDIAILRNGTDTVETLYGSASVGVLAFYGLDPGTDLPGSFVLDNVPLAAAMPRGARFVDCSATVENGTLRTNLLDLTGAQVDFDQSALETGRTTIATTAGAGADSTLALYGSTWTNAGDVVLSNGKQTPASSAASAGLAAYAGSAVAIGGGLFADAGDHAAGFSIVDSSAVVAKDVVLSGPAEVTLLGGPDGSLLRIGGNLLVDASASAASGPLAFGQAFAAGGTIAVAGDIVAGWGAQIHAGTDGVLLAGGAVGILDGGMGIIDAGGTIESDTMVLQPMAFLSGPFAGAPGGPAVIEGLGGGKATILNQGTIETQNLLRIDGNITEHGVLLVGEASQAAGDMVVNGTVTAQAMHFGASGSQLFAQDFGVGNVVMNFLQGDIIATPGIASIGFDAASKTLTIDKQSGVAEHLTIGKVDDTGLQFTLAGNEFITLQPTTA